MLISNLIYYSFLKGLMHSNPLSEVWLPIDPVSAHGRQHFHSGCEHTNRASPQWERKIGLCVWRTASGRHRSLEQQVQDWLSVVSSPAKGEPRMCQKSLMQQWPGPNSLSRSFSLRAKNVRPLLSNTQKRTSLSEVKATNLWKLEGWAFFFSFFLKAWMSCHADSWEAGQSGSWVLYYTSKIQPALPNFVSLAPSCLLGHLHT